MIRPTGILVFAVLSAATSVAATPTVVTVRAVSRDAKVIGDGVGGARITVRDAGTDEVLASGIQTGGPGDTKRLMQEPRAHAPRGTELRVTLPVTIAMEEAQLARAAG